jgi:hypothetical protein
MNVLPVFLALAITAEPSEADQKKYEEAARKSINATGPAIDACTARYLEEQPGSEGVAKVAIQIGKGGVVSSAAVDTPLPQPRSLKECLERIARGWRMPPPQTDKPDELKLQIPVKKGAKFKIYGPGEQPPPEAANEPQGFLQFTPSFLRNYDQKGQE